MSELSHILKSPPTHPPKTAGRREDQKASPDQARQDIGPYKSADIEPITYLCQEHLNSCLLHSLGAEKLYPQPQQV